MKDYANNSQILNNLILKKKNTQKEVSGDKFSEVGSKRKNNI